MSFQPEHIGPPQLALALVFIGVAAGCSIIFRLGLARDLAVGTLRTFAQLLAMGYALKLVFGLQWFWLTLGVFALMLASAARIVIGRVREPGVSYGMSMFLSMAGSYALVTVVVTGLIIQSDPWWRPEYFLPIGGMVIGNSMNALAIALERLFSGLRDGRERVEMLLLMGASPSEASRDVVRDAIRAGMIPSINSLMGVGLVFIPGMMTGQILAGADPLLAIRYQIVVMLMLVGSTALGAILVVLLARRRCFGPGERLVLPRETGRESARRL